MAKAGEAYQLVIVETFELSGSGLHGDVHVRPIPNQPFPTHLLVECSKSLTRD